MAWVSETHAGHRYTHELQNKPLFIQYLTVLDEQRLVLKGICGVTGMGMGTGKTPNTHGFTHAIP